MARTYQTTGYEGYYEAERSRAHEAGGNGRNVGKVERWSSIAAGTGLMAWGLRGGRIPRALAAIGGGLVYRGVTGYCPVYARIGRNTRRTDTKTALGGSRGVRLEESVIINVPVDQVYQFWRRLENLPRFMKHLESVHQLDRKRSHWVAKGAVGARMEWDANIINEIENQLISWRSLDGADVVSAGSVTFWEALGGRGTEVAVRLQYDPPAGKVGASIAWLFGEEPSRQIRADLQRLKQSLENEYASDADFRRSPQPSVI